MLIARRHWWAALQVVNLRGAMCSFVQNEFPSLPVWAFLRLLGLVLKRARNPIAQISWFVMDSDCSACLQQGLPPFASALGWALSMQVFCVTWVWVVPAPALQIPREFGPEVALLVWELLVSFREQR